MKNKISNILHSLIFHNRNKARVKIKSIKSRQFPFEIEIVAEKLYVPWAIDISNDGKLYFTERSGSIRIIENSKLNPEHLSHLIFHL